MTMRTPLSRVRGLGSAKSGTEHWWLQRVTAIANIPLILFLIFFVVSHLGAGRADVVWRPEVGLADIEADGAGRAQRFVGDLANA